MMRFIADTVFTVSGSLALSLVVKATLVTALALLIAPAMRRSPASRRHNLFMAAFSALLLLPAAAAIMPAVRVNILVAPSRPMVGASRVLGVGDRRFDVSTPNADASFKAHPTERGWPSISRSTVLSGIWPIGMLACLVPITIGLWQIRRVRRDGLPWHDAQAITNAIACDIGVGRSVDVLLHEAVVGPMTCGVVRPVIVFPLDARTWSDASLRRAITHELEHIRRRDWLTLCIARLVCTFYWFHPLVWMSCRHLCLEAERACDDAVLRDSDALGYADQLVALAQRLAEPSGGTVLAMANRGDLSARVNAVLDPDQSRSRTETTWLALSTITAAVLAFILAPLQAVAIARAQGPTAAAKPVTFEVASVKANKSGDIGSTFQLQPRGGFRAVNLRLRDLIAMAYGPPPLPDFELTGGPKWIDTDRFDIVAKADHEWQAGSNGPPPQLFLMLQSLLAERFHLGAHRETRVMSIYALILARSDGTLGPQLHKSTADCAALVAAMRARGGPPAPPKAGERPMCSARMLPGNLSGSSVTMAELTNALSGFVSRTVVDRSRLTGGYDMDLQWAPDQMPQGRGALPPGVPGLPPVDSNGPSLFTALQEQLGLKLESTRGPVNVLVIDRAEQPTKD